MRSFEACGIAAYGKQVPIEHLNGRLRGVLGFHERLEEMGEDEDIIDTDEEDEISSDMEIDI